MNQLMVTNNFGEKFYLYKQSTMTSNKGMVTMHFFNKKQNFCPETIQKANKIPEGYTVHECPFKHRITLPPNRELPNMLANAYRGNQ